MKINNLITQVLKETFSQLEQSTSESVNQFTNQSMLLRTFFLAMRHRVVVHILGKLQLRAQQR